MIRDRFCTCTMRLALAAGLLTTLTVTAFAQARPDEETTRQMMAAQAGFECAVFGAEAGDLAPPGEIDRLSIYAYDNASLAYATIAPLITKDGAGPWSKLFERVEPGFWIGLSFSESNKTVSAILDEKHSFSDGGSYDEIRRSRNYYAKSQFDMRNCELVGK